MTILCEDHQPAGSPRKGSSTLHLRNTPQGNSPYRKEQLSAARPRTEDDSTNNYKEDKKRRRMTLRSKFQTNVGIWVNTTLRFGSSRRMRNTLGIASASLLLLLLIVIVSSSQFQVWTFQMRMQPTQPESERRKPRILYLNDIHHQVRTTTETSVDKVLSTSRIIIESKDRHEKRLRQQATDWFYIHTEDVQSDKEKEAFTFAEPFETETCKAMHPWQTYSFPTCNLLHEYQIQFEDVLFQKILKINYGFFRDIWRLQVLPPTHHQYVVLKTLRTDKQFDEFNADRHRRDAVAMERLTSSPNVVNIYGHCGNSQFTEYSGEGDVYDAVFQPRKQPLTKQDAIQIALQVATGVADVHNLETNLNNSNGVEGRRQGAPMAHTDIAPTQFIRIDSFYKLNDFNRVRFIRWNNETNQPCPYQVMNNPGEFRSPEEYLYGNQTEKVDIYSMGNVFYVLLTSTWPWDGMKEEDAQKNVIEGKRPFVNASIIESTHPVDKALLKAMEMCHEQDPNQRASAEEVLQFLTNEAKKFTR